METVIFFDKTGCVSAQQFQASLIALHSTFTTFARKTSLMKLQDDFYFIEGAASSDGAAQYDLRLNPGHAIYQAHFPGQPVTPGVCIIRMVQELAGREVGKSLLLRQVDKARFLHVLSPLEYGRVQVSLVLVPLAEGGYRADATVAAGAVTFAQLRLTLE